MSDYPNPSVITDFLNLNLLPSVHGGGEGGGVYALMDTLLERASHLMEPGHSVDWLPGIQILGKNIHPMLVHFPIALLTLYFLLDLSGTLLKKAPLRASAGAMLYLGAVGALFTVAAGFYAASVVPHDDEVHEILEWHQGLGLTVATLAVALAIWRYVAKGKFGSMTNTLHLLLAAIMVTCLFFGADLGGLMVYGHGVAVKRAAVAETPHHHHDHDHDHSED